MIMPLRGVGAPEGGQTHETDGQPPREGHGQDVSILAAMKADAMLGKDNVDGFES